MNARTKTIAKHLNRVPEVLRCAKHTRNWLSVSFCYIGLGQDSFPLTTELRRGGSFELRDLADVATWWQVFYRHVYPVRPTDRVIVDAGANIGAFTLYALERAPSAKVLAIEPFPETFSRLTNAVAKSPFRDRVRLLNVALSSRSGLVAMQGGKMGSQFRRVVSDDSPQEHVSVPACTLAEALEGVEGEVDLLKLDIEGSEYDSILGCPLETLRRIRRVAMEFHPLYTANAPQPNDLFERFAAAGLRTTSARDHGEGYGMAYLRRD